MDLKETLFPSDAPPALKDRLGALSDMLEQTRYALALVARLRGPNGCPWDREQNHLTIRPYLMEEAAEALEVLDRYRSTRDPKALAKATPITSEVPADGAFTPEDQLHLKEELGDVLLQVILHSQLCWERGEFHFGDVAEFMARKLVSRHPHVFGETKVDGSEGVLDNWEQIKKKEKEKKGTAPAGLGVPKALPSLQRAERVSDKAGRLGFDWKRKEDVMLKLDEEVGELKEALQSGDMKAMEHELGDAIFALCQVARWNKIHPEDAHRKAVGRFEARFEKVEEWFKERGVPMGGASEQILEEAWNWAKTQMKGKE
jgi:MazG family protein